MAELTVEIAVLLITKNTFLLFFLFYQRTLQHMFDVLDMPFCAFSRTNGDFKRHFKFEPGGKIKDVGNLGNDNERFWSFDGKILTLYSGSKSVTSVFYLKELTNAHCLFEGYFMDKIPLKIVCFKNRSDLFTLKTKYQSQELIVAGFLTVGDHTYGKVDFLQKELSKIKIGDYCSIAHHVEFIGSNHRLDLVSTYPFYSLCSFWVDDELDVHDHVNKGDIIVGNDVWIGRSAKIMSGVTIGDGAVIAAGAIITKNVEPYSVVAGNPAKHKKYRIEDENDRRKMQEIAWWNWSEEKVASQLEKIMSSDIKGFIHEFYPQKDV